jgi:hypothetical protein
MKPRLAQCVDLLQDALILAPRGASRRSTDDHHDSDIFLSEIVVLDVLGGTSVGCVLRLVLPTKVFMRLQCFMACLTRVLW